MGAELFLEFGRHTYSEVTPSGAGCRIWGLADGAALHRKFTLEIDGKEIAVELFRRTRKALTITGYRLDTIRELTDIDKVLDWGVIWGERRKAAAAAAAPVNGHAFNGNGCGYSVDQIEQIVRAGAPEGANRSDVFHTVVGHYLGCGWTAEQILAHLQQFPQGIGERYLREDRLHREIARSASKYAAAELPLSAGWVDGWEAKAPLQPEPEVQPGDRIPSSRRPLEPELQDELDDEEPPEQQPDLPPMYAHGDPDPRPLKSWLVKHLIPECGHGLTLRPVGHRQDVCGVRPGGRAGDRPAVPGPRRQAPVRRAADRSRGRRRSTASPRRGGPGQVWRSRSSSVPLVRDRADAAAEGCDSRS